MLTEVVELLAVELRHDFDFTRIGTTAQATQKALLDHCLQIAASITVEMFAEHPRGFHILHAIQQNQRLQRRIGPFPFGGADRPSGGIEGDQRRRRPRATPIRVHRQRYHAQVLDADLPPSPAQKKSPGRCDCEAVAK